MSEEKSFSINGLLPFIALIIGMVVGYTMDPLQFQRPEENAVEVKEPVSFPAVMISRNGERRTFYVSAEWDQDREQWAAQSVHTTALQGLRIVALDWFRHNGGLYFDSRYLPAFDSAGKYLGEFMIYRDQGPLGSQPPIGAPPTTGKAPPDA